MSSLENSLFQLKFTSKTLKKEALKAKKEEKSEKGKVKKHIQQGEQVLARIYAQNAIRKAQESVNLLRLASRIDAVSSRVNTAVVMRNVTGSMRNVVRGMDKAMQHMNLEQISGVMDKFEQQFEDLDVQSGYMENAMGDTSVQFLPQEDVDQLMTQMADEVGVEQSQELGSTVPQGIKAQKEAIEPDQELQDRLKAIRG